MTRGDTPAALARVRETIRQATPPGAPVPDLVVITKTIGPERILPLLAAGQRHFGENRVQEAAGKWPALRQRCPDIVLHMTGSLQTNKVREAVALFDIIESLDRPRLAGELARECRRQGREMPCLIQVNIGQDPGKHGVSPGDTVAFVSLCRGMSGLSVAGLMCILPGGAEPAPLFRRMRELAAATGLSRLSMGMSDDYVEAVRNGAGSVRIGRAIFGDRPRPSPGAASPGES